MAEANNLFQLEIVTPERVFYTGEAHMVEFTSQNGEVGIYKNHIPMTMVIAPGVLRIKEAQGDKLAALHAGFVEILPEKITILAEVAEWPEDIDLDRAEAAKQRAEERLQSHAEDMDVKRAEIALKRALVRLDLKK